MYLLDTHAFIWATLETNKLSNRIVEIILDKENEIFVSAVTFWEISLKTSIKKLSFEKIDIKAFPSYAREMGFTMSFSQNSVSFGKSFRKSGLKPAFSFKFKVAFPKLKFWESLPL
jgi:predicted nucleic acid-binding protein